MDDTFKAKTIQMVDKHLTILRNNMVASVEAQRDHTIDTYKAEYDQLADMERQLTTTAEACLDELNKAYGKMCSTIHMTLSNVMAPITARKQALYDKLQEFENPQPEPIEVEVVRLPAPKKNGFFKSKSKVKAAHG